jgi:GTPase
MSEGPDGWGLPVVAVVGRPNVGKSSLVNRILGKGEAIVDPTPGVTRDRSTFVAEWDGRSFEIVDTGGLEPGPRGLEERVVEQAQVAIELADVILFLVDAATGPLEDDLVVADALRRANKPVLVVANKADDPRDEPEADAFYRIGLGDPWPVSALHGRGTGDMLEALIQLLPEHSPGVDNAWGSIAIVGRPNVGKSSLLNRLLGEERAIVDRAPGTTRAPVDSWLTLDDGARLRLVDTAGMRREVKVKDPIEYFSLLRSRRTLERVDAAILVVDAAEGVTGPDQRLAQEIVQAGRACVVALNKWDLVTPDPTDRGRLEETIQERLRFLRWATSARVSAKTGRGVDRLVPLARSAIEAHRTRLATAGVNRIIRSAQERRPHPRANGRAVRIMYAVQARSGPPTFLLFARGRLQESYLRYLENRLRAEAELEGTPVRLVPRRARAQA